MFRFRRRTGWSGFWWIVAVVCVLGFGIGLTWCNWDVLRGCQESVSATLRNVGLLTGGVIAIILALWRSRVAERQAITALRQSKTAERGLLNERYQKGAEMLGNEVISVRLGGIYALTRLAGQHPQEYRIQIMQLFCAFARHPTEDKSSDLHVEGEEYPRLREDVQAIMTTIGSRGCAGLCSETKKGFRLDLFGANLVGLKLVRANLSGADMWKADLSGALLLDADLSKAGLLSANLTDSKLGSANLRSADLSDAHLANAKLDGADLSDATLYRATMPHVRAQKAKFPRANLASANLKKANLTNADLSYTTIRNTDLSHAILRDANLSGALIGKGIHPEPSSPESAFTQVTQHQLNEAVADPHNPPTIETGTVDIDTGEPLVWRGGR